MSRYEWERGEIVIPSKEWSGFKQRIREVLNKVQERRLAIAQDIHAHLAAESKGKRNFRFFDAAWDYARPKTQGGYYSAAKWDSQDVEAAIHGILQSRPGAPFKHRLRKPLKKTFPIYGNTTTEFHDNDCSVVFDNGSRTATWDVHENNHACDHARVSALGRAFFGALKAVTWTRGSGGEIVGNDELNHDNRHAGGGSNYVKQSFGPKNPKEKSRPGEPWGVSISWQTGPRRRF